MAQTLNDIYQVILSGSVFNQTIMLSRSYRVSVATGGSDVQTAQAFANKLQADGAGLIPFYLDCLPNAYLLDFVQVQKVWPIRAALRFTLIGQNGNNPAVQTVNQSAWGITMATDLAGRNQRSTVHIGPACADDSANGIALAGISAKLQALAGALQLAQVVPGASGGTYVPTIFHRPTSTKPGTWNDITASEVHDQLRTMRRRVVGRGV